MGADFGLAADVFDVDALVLVEEKHGGAGGVDELADLVEAEVAVEAGFFVEAMGFIHHQATKLIPPTLHKRPCVL